jgi:hypothetical protein
MFDTQICFPRVWKFFSSCLQLCYITTKISLILFHLLIYRLILQQHSSICTTNPKSVQKGTRPTPVPLSTNGHDPRLLQMTSIHHNVSIWKMPWHLQGTHQCTNAQILNKIEDIQQHHSLHTSNNTTTHPKHAYEFSHPTLPHLQAIGDGA